MNVFKRILNKITSFGWLQQGSMRIESAPQKSVLIPATRETGVVTLKTPDVMPARPTAPPEPPVYGHQVSGLLFVSTDEARRMISDGNAKPPSEELKQVTRDAMLHGMVTDAHKKVIGNFAGEANSLVGKLKDAQDIADSKETMAEFKDKAENPPEQTSGLRKSATPAQKAKLETTKADIKAKIPSAQSARSVAIKKKKKAASATNKRKNK
jgi:hypothetical protein